MTCSNCGKEFDGNFCPICGCPAPQMNTCQSCGTEYEGYFCPNCGQEAELPMDEICQNLYDIEDNHIDVNLLAEAYLSVEELRGYFQRNTYYSPEEIELLSDYIYNNIDGGNLGILKIISLKTQFEAPGKRLSAEERRAMASAYAPDRPLSKRERIKENKRNGVACCPKCGSTSLSSGRQGFGFGKAAVGIWAAGVPGALLGSVGAKKTLVTCLNCGHRWKM